MDDLPVGQEWTPSAAVLCGTPSRRLRCVQLGCAGIQKERKGEKRKEREKKTMLVNTKATCMEDRFPRHPSNTAKVVLRTATPSLKADDWCARCSLHMAGRQSSAERSL
eukprot:1158426-Pelagomonas_calceolata.AAC.7